MLDGQSCREYSFVCFIFGESTPQDVLKIDQTSQFSLLISLFLVSSSPKLAGNLLWSHFNDIFCLRISINPDRLAYCVACELLQLVSTSADLQVKLKRFIIYYSLILAVLQHTGCLVWTLARHQINYLPPSSICNLSPCPLLFPLFAWCEHVSRLQASDWFMSTVLTCDWSEHSVQMFMLDLCACFYSLLI